MSATIPQADYAAVVAAALNMRGIDSPSGADRMTKAIFGETTPALAAYESVKAEVRAELREHGFTAVEFLDGSLDEL